MSKIFQSVDVVMFAVVGTIAFALGMWGYWDCSFTFIPDPADAAKKIPYFHKDAACHLSNWWQMALATINLVKAGGDFTLSRVPPDPWQLVIAQLAIPAIAVLAAGKIVYDKLRRDVHIMMAGRKNDHIIICGLGATAMQITQNLHGAEQRQGIVVIDHVGEAVNAATCESMGIPVVSGDAKNERILAIAGLRRARSVVIATGDDTRNLDIALRMRDIHASLPARQRRPITVFTEIDNDWLFTKLHSQQNQTIGSTEVEIRLVNSYENSTRLLIRDMPLPVAPELSTGALVVIGFGKMGRTVTMQFLSASPTALGQRMRIIAVDREIDEASQALDANAPAAREFADFTFVNADLTADKSVGWAAVTKLIADQPLQAVVACLGEDLDNLFVGMEMRRILDSHDQFHVPVYVRLQHHDRLGHYATTTEVMIPIADRLKGFGTLEKVLSRDILFDASIDKLPRAWHDKYRRTLPPGRRDVPANRPWAELPEFYKMSNRRVCDHLPIKLAQAGLRLEEMSKAPELAPEGAQEPVVVELTADEIDLLARLEHRRWLISRRMLGWQHGEKRNEAKRLNPLLVEWDALPQAEQEQHQKEAADLPKFLAGLGYVLRRVHLVRAYGDWLATAGAMMDEVESYAGQRRYIVLAEVDRADGFAIAERAIDIPDTSLWLASREDPLTLEHSLDEGLARRFKILLQKADGWTRRDHLVARSHSARETAGKANPFTVRAVPAA
jgi:hypothetical protein